MTTTVLELAISLALLYLIISGFCSALQELVANTFRWRSKTLEEALGNLLKDPKIADQIYNHALAGGLWTPAWLLKKKNPRKPSYISADTFARIVLDLQDNKKLSDASSEIVQKLTKSAGTEITQQRKAIEQWFDDSMDRVSGWYKRKANAYLWLIGLVVCLFLNADSINLSQLLWNDEALRESVVTVAKDYVKENPKPEQSNNDTKQGSSDAPNSDAALAKLRGARATLDKISLPLGWCDEKICWPLGGTPTDEHDPRSIPTQASFWWAFLKIAGILITVLAVSQGAPFWFDLLQKAVNLSLSGEKPPSSASPQK